MWNSALVACARAYPTGVLSVVDAAGFPDSIRCRPAFDAAREVITFEGPVPAPAVGEGPACLLFHRHNAELGDQHELLIRGRLSTEEGRLQFHPEAFLTGSGRLDTDRMPVAGSLVDIWRFMILGRRKSREYLAKRGAPWPPTPFKKMLRYLDEP